MNDQRIPKKIINTKPEGRRNIGRQKLRWLDGVEDDLRTLGVRRWRQKALVGQEWTKILREAKARLQGPYDWRPGSSVGRAAGYGLEGPGLIPGGDRIFSRCQTFRTAPRFTQPPIKLSSFPGWAGNVARMGESRNAYRVLVGRPEGKRPLRRPRRRWEDNIKMDLREVGYDDRDWINLAQDRDRWRAYVRAAMNLRVKFIYIMDCLFYRGCKTWTLTLREEQRLRVFENKVLRKIFGDKRDEVTGEWRKLQNAELHALYSSPDIIRNIKSRRLRWAGHVARMGESRNACRVLLGRPEGKRPLGRPRCRWEDNIKMDLREVGYDDRGWINLAQDRDQWRAFVSSHSTQSSTRLHKQHSERESGVYRSPKRRGRYIRMT
ncbi:hypothetical protein ANN_09069 [Periplaneta americana]|uniref:Uncharacterized protein n=1 Tax=Periplaneta americana TaxID=6978 RepID=A0ABQ8TMR2_PERAM|nr:hypothetical protein ANN_09069 [Periplaneta americana]